MLHLWLWQSSDAHETLGDGSARRRNGDFYSSMAALGGRSVPRLAVRTLSALSGYGQLQHEQVRASSALRAHGYDDLLFYTFR